MEDDDDWDLRPGSAKVPVSADFDRADRPNPHHQHHPQRPMGRARNAPPAQMLSLLHKAGRIRSAEELIEVALRLPVGGPTSAAYLDEECRHLPIDLAIDKLSLFLREQSYIRRAEFFEAACEGTTALVLPLPPPVLEEMVRLPDVWVIALEGHELPPTMRRAFPGRQVSNIYDARQIVHRARAVVFDAHIDARGAGVRRMVADLLTPLGDNVLLGVHQRPHPFPEDLPVPAFVRDRMILM